MDPIPPKPKHGPEAKIQDDLCAFLKKRDWVVMETHGNAYQKGFPDLYIAHFRYGTRWVEVKYAAKYAFTRAQRHYFPLLDSAGVGIWVLTAATEEEYLKLWQPSNWHQFLEVNKVISRPRAAKSEGYIPKYPFKIPEK